MTEVEKLKKEKERLQKKADSLSSQKKDIDNQIRKNDGKLEAARQADHCACIKETGISFERFEILTAVPVEQRTVLLDEMLIKAEKIASNNTVKESIGDDEV